MSRISRALDWSQHHMHSAYDNVKSDALAFKETFTRENFKQLMREIFSAIAQIYVCIGLSIAAIPFGISSLIKRCMKLPTNFKIGSESETLSAEEVSYELREIAESMRKVTSLEFQHSEEGALIFNADAIESLKIILPPRIICQQSQLPPDVLSQLATETHFYKQSDDFTYSFTPKIVDLDLPADTQEACRLIEELTVQGEQVIKIYYPTAIKPKNQQDLKKFHRSLMALNPSLIMEKLYPKDPEQLQKTHELIIAKAP